MGMSICDLKLYCFFRALRRAGGVEAAQCDSYFQRLRHIERQVELLEPVAEWAQLEADEVEIAFELDDGSLDESEDDGETTEEDGKLGAAASARGAKRKAVSPSAGSAKKARKSPAAKTPARRPHPSQRRLRPRGQARPPRRPRLRRGLPRPPRRPKRPRRRRPRLRRGLPRPPRRPRRLPKSSARGRRAPHASCPSAAAAPRKAF